MPRYRINPKIKAVPCSFALAPDDIEKLNFIQEHYKFNRSKTLQKIIESEYFKIKEGISNEQ